MSNALTATRDALKQLLDDAGLFAFAVLPETVTPPVCLVGPGSPYLSYEGAGFGSQIVRLSIAVLADAGTNDVTVETLDELILRVIDAVDGRGPEDVVFQVDGAGQPGQLPLNGQNFLGAVIDVQTEIRRPTS